MERNLDCSAEAEKAMTQAAAASSAADRMKWLRAAVAWQQLARDGLRTAQHQCDVIRTDLRES